MMLRQRRAKILLPLLFGTMASLLTGCDIWQWLFSVANPPPPKQFPAAFETVAESNYSGSDALPYSVGQNDALAQVLKGAGDTQISRRIDGQASASNFLEYNNAIDAEIFSGHGYFGTVDFIDESYFGPGQGQSSYTPNFPIQGGSSGFFLTLLIRSLGQLRLHQVIPGPHISPPIGHRLLALRSTEFTAFGKAQEVA